MKKRIISLILTVALLVLTLVGCGYNYTKDDLSKYASFDKASFEADLAKLIIEDGDFTTNEETRAKRVLDAVYKALADKADTTKTVTVGVAGDHDLLYYCYYITATIDGKEVMFVGDEMTPSKAKKVQLGLQFPTDLEAAIIEAATNLDLTDKAYSQVNADDATTEDVNESKAKEGQFAYISYKYSYKEITDGVEKTKEVTVTKERVVLDKNNPVHAALLKDGETIGLPAADFVDNKGTEDEADDVSYKDATINWVEKGAPIATFTEKTYDAATTKTDVYGKSQSLKDVELTYHVYPVHFVAVDALTAENIINVIYADSISYSVITKVLFGTDFDDKTEDEQKALLDEYKFTKDGKELTLSDFITNIKNLQTTYASDKKAYDSAVTKVETEEASLKKAQDAVTAAGGEDKATAAQKEAVTTATNALKVAKDVLAEETEDLKESTEARDEAVKTLLTKKADTAEDFVTGYEKYTYKNLEASYNSEIKTAVATEIYKLIEKYVTVNSVPDKAVDETYDQMIQNYQHAFYENETLDGDSKESNKDKSYYALYKGSFKNFLIKCVVPNEFDKTVSTYAEAKDAVRAEAEKIVAPILRIYVASEAYGVTISNKDFKQIAKDDINFTYNESLYGENTVRNAYQFDKLMDTILGYEENDGKATYNNKIAFTFKTDAEEEVTE